MKRILALCCIFCFLCNLLPQGAVANEDGINKYFLPEINLGSPLETAQPQHCLVDTVNGVNYMYTTSAGSPAVFNVINLDEKKVEGFYQLPGCSKVWKHVKDSKGRIYIIDFKLLFCYDPAEKKITNYGRYNETETAAFSLCVDEEDNVYIGTYPNAKIIKFDPITATFEDWGTILEGMQYIRNITYHKGYLYCGVYSTNPGKMVRVEVKNPKNKKVFEAPPSSLYTPEDISFFYDSNMADDMLVNYVQTKTLYRMLVFDTVKEEWVDNGYDGGFKGLYSTPAKDGRSYFAYQNRWKALNTQNGMIEDIDWEGNTYSIWGGDWIELKDNPDFPGKTFVTLDLSVAGTGFPLFINFETKKTMVWNDLDMKGAYLVLLNIGDMPDGGIVVSSQGAPKNYWFNSDTGESAIFTAGQIEGTTKYDDKLYLGAYTGARLLEYDPSSPPVDNVNPKQIAVVTEQDRPFAMEAGDGKIYGGTIAKYGHLAGSLFVYDTQTGEFFEENNVVNNQSIMGIAYKDGMIYGSTTVYGGFGVEPTEKEAKIFIYDVKKREKVKEFVPDIPGLTDPVPTYIGDLEFGPDGKLWGATGFTLFSIDPWTEKVSDVFNFGRWEKYDTYRWLPYRIEFDDKGNIYIEMGGIRVINPKTGATKTLTNYVANLYTIGGDGNLYMAVGSDIRMIPIFDKQPTFDYVAYAQSYLNQHTVLKTRNAVASVKGSIRYIDSDNKSVVPAVEEDRALVPIRFIGESFGAEVAWDEDSQTAVITKDDVSVSVTVGKKEMGVNGSIVTMDVPAKTINDRIFIPLRAVSDAFGKQVLWDERGLIVISDEEQRLSDEQLEALNFYFRFYIRNHIMDKNAIEASKQEYNELLSKVNGERVDIPNQSFETVCSDTQAQGFTRISDEGYDTKNMAEFTSLITLEGKRSLRINDTSTELAAGYKTDLIPIDPAQRYKLITPVYPVSGKACIEVYTHDANGKRLYKYANYYDPGVYGAWSFPEIEIDMKGSPQYISIHFFSPQLWQGDCYYDDFALIQMK